MYKLAKLAQNKLFVVAMMLVVSALLVVPAFAKEYLPPDKGVSGTNFGITEIEENMPLGKADFIDTVTQLINVALGLLGVVAVVIILAAGFKWMTAGGNDEKVGEARKMLFAGIIGLAIILSAWAIARFVLTQLAGATNTQGWTEVV